MANDGEHTARTRDAGGIRRQPPTCSFCGGPQPGIGQFIAGPDGVGICGTCVGKASAVLSAGQAEATPLSAITPVPADATAAQCSFCGKHRHQVAGLAATASAAGTADGGVSICTECLDLAREIITERPG